MASGQTGTRIYHAVSSSLLSRTTIGGSSVKAWNVVGRSCRSVASVSGTRPTRTTTITTTKTSQKEEEWHDPTDIPLGHEYQPSKYQIQVYNQISPSALARFPTFDYVLRRKSRSSSLSLRLSSCSSNKNDDGDSVDAILLRSYPLKEDDVPSSVRAIARCGPSTDNIPVSRMTEQGIPVFHTPSSNVNAVKELILLGMLIASRRVVEGISHIKDLAKTRSTIAQKQAEEEKEGKVNEDMSAFVGRELRGKTLAVLGLGCIGSALAIDASTALGMKVVGYDPDLSASTAVQLPHTMQIVESMQSAVQLADYVSVNIPYSSAEPSQGGTHGLIGKEVIARMKPDVILLNFTRGELVDSRALQEFLNRNDTSARYVTDFPDTELWNREDVIMLPHLGSSTREAEEAAAVMAVDTLRDFLQTGTIRHSVNFPTTSLPDSPGGTVRCTVVGKNIPGFLAAITEAFAGEKLNIVQEITHSRGDIAYTVLDIDRTCLRGGNLTYLKTVQDKIASLRGVLNTRILSGLPGSGLAKEMENEDGEWYQ